MGMIVDVTTLTQEACSPLYPAARERWRSLPANNNHPQVSPMP